MPGALLGPLLGHGAAAAVPALLPPPPLPKQPGTPARTLRTHRRPLAFDAVGNPCRLPHSALTARKNDAWTSSVVRDELLMR